MIVVLCSWIRSWDLLYNSSHPLPFELGLKDINNLFIYLYFYSHALHYCNTLFLDLNLESLDNVLFLYYLN